MARAKAEAPATTAKARNSKQPVKVFRKVIAPDVSKDSDDRETSSSSDDEEPGTEQDTDDSSSSSSGTEELEDSEDSTDAESTASSDADCDDGRTVACLDKTVRLHKVCASIPCDLPFFSDSADADRREILQGLRVP